MAASAVDCVLAPVAGRDESPVGEIRPGFRGNISLVSQDAGADEREATQPRVSCAERRDGCSAGGRDGEVRPRPKSG